MTHTHSGFEPRTRDPERRDFFDLRRRLGALERGGQGGLVIEGTIPTVGPPTDVQVPPASRDEGDIWIDSNGDGWSWNGTSWVNIGPIQGPTGPAGPQGPTGPDEIYIGPTDPIGTIPTLDMWYDTDADDAHSSYPGRVLSVDAGGNLIWAEPEALKFGEAAAGHAQFDELDGTLRFINPATPLDIATIARLVGNELTLKAAAHRARIMDDSAFIATQDDHVMTRKAINQVVQYGTWTPTWTGFNPGTGATVNAVYTWVGGRNVGDYGMLKLQIVITLGTGFTAWSSGHRLGIPSAFRWDPVNHGSSELATFEDVSAGSRFYGRASIIAPTLLSMGYMHVNGTAIDDAVLTSTIPFAWAAGDRYHIVAHGLAYRA